MDDTAGPGTSLSIRAAATQSELSARFMIGSDLQPPVSVATLDLQKTEMDVVAPLTGINLIVRRSGYK